LNKYRETHGGGGTETEVTLDERARLKELEYEYLDTCRIDAAETNPVDTMSARLAVSTSGFYHWLSRPTPATAARGQTPTARLRHFFAATDARVPGMNRGQGLRLSPGTPLMDGPSRSPARDTRPGARHHHGIWRGQCGQRAVATVP